MRAPPLMNVAAILTAIILLGHGFRGWDVANVEAEFEIRHTVEPDFVITLPKETHIKTMPTPKTDFDNILFAEAELETIKTAETKIDSIPFEEADTLRIAKTDFDSIPFDEADLDTMQTAKKKSDSIPFDQADLDSSIQTTGAGIGITHAKESENEITSPKKSKTVFKVVPNVLNSKLVLDSSKVLATTADDFICATLDWWPPEKCDYGTCAWHNASMLNLDLSHPRLRQAMKALAPFVLRLGGSLQDDIVYRVGDPLPKDCPPITRAPRTPTGFRGGCLPMERWDALNRLCLTAGCRIAFGLNALSGREKVGAKDWRGPWDPTNSAALIQYSVQRKYPIHSWQLGNEVAGPRSILGRITARQYAVDARALKAVIAKAYGASRRPLLAAADNYFNREWHTAFLQAAGPGVVDIVTRHSYFLGPGVDPLLKSHILDPAYLAGGESGYVDAWETIHRVAPKAQLWIGESGRAYNSGHHLLTDAFISGFWYLDQLGVAASNHHSCYCRQTLVGGNYGLLNASTLQPNPDFYSALLWRHLMGREVLRVHVAKKKGRGRGLRAYAHCHRRFRGGVMLLLLNLDREATREVAVELKGHREDPHPLGSWREEYHLTAAEGDLHSQTTVLNGHVLELSHVASLSKLAVVVRGKGAGPIRVAPHSYAFVGLPEAQLAVCQGSS